MNQIQKNIRLKTHLLFASVLFLGVSCSHGHRPNIVPFDDASDFCKESRELVFIQSKMIPTDEVLNQKAQDRSALPMDDSAIENAVPATPNEYKLINEEEEERFLTIPKNSFSAVTLPNGKHLVYWIHLVSSELKALDDIEEEPSAVYQIVNNLLIDFHQSGKLKASGWEPKLNDAILKQLKTIPKFQNIANVFIHLGC